MEVNAALTLPAVQAWDTTNPTEQDVILIPPGALVQAVTTMGAVMKKQMELKRNIIQIVMIPGSAVFQIQQRRTAPARGILTAINAQVHQATATVLPECAIVPEGTKDIYSYV